MVFMQILTILRNWKFTYKRNSREYTCVYKEKIYYSFYSVKIHLKLFMKQQP